MVLLVSDTSILIDLERGDLLPLAFSSGVPMVVPDLLYEKELEPLQRRLLPGSRLASGDLAT